MILCNQSKDNANELGENKETVSNLPKMSV